MYELQSRTAGQKFGARLVRVLASQWKQRMDLSSKPSHCLPPVAAGLPYSQTWADANLCKWINKTLFIKEGKISVSSAETRMWSLICARLCPGDPAAGAAVAVLSFEKMPGSTAQDHPGSGNPGVRHNSFCPWWDWLKMDRASEERNLCSCTSF